MGDLAQQHKSVLSKASDSASLQDKFEILSGEPSPKSPRRGRPLGSGKKVTINEKPNVVSKAIDLLTSHNKEENEKKISEGPVEKEKDKYEKERISYIKRYNRYVKDDVLYPKLAESGIKRELLPPECSLSVAKGCYQQAVDALNTYNLKPNVYAAFDCMNGFTETALGFFDKPCPGFAASMRQPEVLKEFEQELSEIAVEWGDVFGGGSYTTRFAIKYAKILFAAMGMQQMMTSFNDMKITSEEK
jgi:hypothetical protein